MALRLVGRAAAVGVVTAALLATVRGGVLAQRSGAEVSWTDDPRLERRITLAQTRVTLEELLRAASGEAGLFLIATSEKRAWKVREMPVSVHVREITVREFMRQLAALLDFTWSRAGEEGRWTYTIWQGANARDREARALRSREDERTARLRSGWDALTSALAGLQKMSPSEIEKAAESDPLFQFAARDPVGRPYTALIGSLGPGVVESVLSGRDYSVPFSALPPAQQQNLQDLMNGMRQFAQKLDPSGRAAGDGAEVDWNRVTLRVSPVPPGVAHSEMVPGGFLGMIQLSGDPSLRGMMSAFPILNPTSDVAKMLARAVVRVHAGEDPQSVFEQMGREMGESLTRAASGRQETQKPDSAELDPLLAQEIELRPQEGQQDAGGALAELPEKAGLNVFAEAWRQPGAQLRVHRGRVADILAALAGAFRCEWELDGSSIRLRSRNWAERRAAMVPKADIEYWKQVVEDNGTLPLDDLAHIARVYTPEQLMEMMMSEPSLAAHLGSLMDPGRKRALQFYGGLDGPSLAALRSSQGLDVRRLSRSQLDALIPILEENGASPQEALVAGATMRLMQDRDNPHLLLTYPPEGSVRIGLRHRQGVLPGREGGGEQPGAER
jgi:hypothetical protein